jgi:hypothetical protein
MKVERNLGMRKRHSRDREMRGRNRGMDVIKVHYIYA